MCWKLSSCKFTQQMGQLAKEKKAQKISRVISVIWTLNDVGELSNGRKKYSNKNEQLPS